MTLVLGFSGWWIAGWAVGFGGAVAAAVLLVVVIRLGRRIASQAREITEALDGARENTGQVFDLTRTNLALDRLTRGLHALDREGSS